MVGWGSDTMDGTIKHLVLNFTQEDFEKLLKDKQATGLDWQRYILYRCLHILRPKGGGKE